MVTLLPGVTATTVSINLYEDQVTESQLKFIAELHHPKGAHLGTNAQAVIAIMEEEGMKIIKLSCTSN